MAEFKTVTEPLLPIAPADLDTLLKEHLDLFRGALNEGFGNLASDFRQLDSDVGEGIFLKRDGSLELTDDWDAGAFGVTLGSLNVGTATGAGVGDIHASGDVGIGTNSPNTVLHVKANTAGMVGSHHAGQIIIQNPADSVLSNVVITAYESDSDGNPDQQLWYLGSASISNSDITFLNRRNARLTLGTNDATRMTIGGDGNVEMSGDLTALGGLNVGSATGAGVGDIKGSGALTINDLHSIDQMDFDAVLEDKISLYDNRLGATNMYGFGVESGYVYSKAPTGYRFYVGVNADGGASDVLQVTASLVAFMVNARAYADLIVNGGANLGTATGAGAGDLKMSGDVIHAPNLKSGINQGAAGAGAGELWADTGDANTVKLGA